MRTVKRPPRALALPAADSRSGDGAVRKWNSTKATKGFRVQLTLWLARRQKGRCTYCSLPVGDAGRRSRALDHFVPKAGATGVAEWTFELCNLILACEFCNSRKKKNFNPLSVRGTSYKKSQFSLFHPYLDRAADHIEGGYRGGADEPSTPQGISDAGRATITLFELATPGVRELWSQERRAAVDRNIRRDWTARRIDEFENARTELDRSFGL